MSIDSFSLIEHFDYMKRVVPQPFAINSSDVSSFKKEDNGLESEYVIELNNKNKYTLSKSSLKKLVDALGIKVKLLNAVCSESDVIDLALPIIDKLFKCFSDCFVFYSTSDDPLTIIDLNVNSNKGDEGTKYEDGPSPWLVSIADSPESFTCFANFMTNHAIDDNDTSILVKSEDILLKNKQVVIKLFKSLVGSKLQPMLVFSSKFSNMDGFTEIHPALYDSEHDISVMFPMNYGNARDPLTFDSMWKRVTHINESTDLDDFIFREVNELAASDETPSSVKTFISNILTDSTLNINQPIKDILDEASRVSAQMKPSKKKKFYNQLGCLIGYALVMKHSGCSECGHMHI